MVVVQVAALGVEVLGAGVVLEARVVVVQQSEAPAASVRSCCCRQHRSTCYHTITLLRMGLEQQGTIAGMRTRSVDMQLVNQPHVHATPHTALK
jgi:hypothetical protein